MPKVTIIIATYNSGKTVRAALESVHSQTYQDWECIVVDGASRDDTIDIVKNYCELDNRFRYISERDHGIYEAFNKGLRMAKGEWVHYLGSDDRLVKNGMEKLMEKCEEGDLLIGNTFLVKPGGEITRQKSHGRMGCHQSMLTRKAVVEALGGFDEKYRIVADTDLNVRLQKAGYRIKNVDCYVSFFSVGGVSQSVKNSWNKTRELYRIYSKHHCYKHPFLRCSKIFTMNVLTWLSRKIKKVER